MMGSSPGSGSGSVYGSGSRYLDPHRVYELVIRRMPANLLEYLDSIPGPSRDFHWQGVKLVAKALLDLVSEPPRLSPSEHNRDILLWAQLARFHATIGRFCAPQMVGNSSNFTRDAGHNMHPQNSSSCSGRMLNHESDSIGHNMHPHNSSSWSGRMLNHESDSIELRQSAAHRLRTLAANRLQEEKIDVHRHDAMKNPLSASGSKILATMLPPLQANTMISFPTRRAGMRDETSASNSGTHASAYVPSGDNSMLGGSAASGQGALLLRKSIPPSRAVTSPPPRAVTSPARMPLRSRRRKLPLRTCQRRTLSVPRQEVEATSPPPLSGRAPRPRRGHGLVPLRALDSWPFGQTIESERVVHMSDTESARKKFSWAKAVKSWSDDDEWDSWSS